MAEDDKKPPWGSDDEFNPQKAWDLIQKLRGEAKTAKDEHTATKAKLAAAEGERDAAVSKLTDRENEGKSESEKLAAKLADMERDLNSERDLRVRSEVAAAKGLTAAQAKRLAGSTKEELEADADEILEAFPVSDGTPKGPPSQKPSSSLQGGTDPTEPDEKVDVAKLADAIPRP